MSLCIAGERQPSHLGGDPRLPASAKWPSREGRPLTHLATLDLSEIAKANTISWLPDTGKLLFFYDIDEQPWGFDPKDRDGWSVLHVPEPSADQAADPVSRESALPEIPVRFQRVESLPSLERLRDLSVAFTDVEEETYEEGLFELREDELGHQMGGFPSPIQNDDMELECQLASNGVNLGDGAAHLSETAEQHAPGAKNWRLLLQLCDHDELGVVWGDMGSLYFWVEEAKSREADFSDVWLVLQCS